MSIRIRLTLCLLLLLVATLPAAAQSGTTALYLDSQPGDLVGEGLGGTWTDADLTFSATYGDSRVTIVASAGGSVRWSLNFVGPRGIGLPPRLYEYATLWENQSDYLNALSVSGPDERCTTSIGRFEVKELVINFDGSIERFAADFEQHCNRAAPALFGAIRYRSTDSSLVPFDGAYPTYTLSIDAAVNGYVTAPGIDCGAGRTDCGETFAAPATIELTATPNPGYVFLGWSGLDCIGTATVRVDVNRPTVCAPVFNAAPGVPATESPNYAANAVFMDGPIGPAEVTPRGRAQIVSVPPYSSLVVETATANGVFFRIVHPAIYPASVSFRAAPGESLAPGLYEPTIHNFFPVGPELDVRSNNVSCRLNGGRFRIYEIAFAGSTLSVFSADFEVPCGTGGTITGSIRYNAARASLLPFDGVYPSTPLTIVPTLGGYVASAAGIDCGDGGRTDCQQTLQPPSTVTLAAIASPGYEFFGWGGLCSGTNTSVTVTIAGWSQCFAAFRPVAGGPSHPFGYEFLMIERSGGPPARRLWLPSEAKTTAAAMGLSSISVSATSMFGGDSVDFFVRSGRIVPGDYDAFDVTDERSPILRVCSSNSRGFFRVYEAVYNPDGTLASFAADFAASCNTPTPHVVVGAVRYRSSRDTVIPFDGAPPIRLAVMPSPHGRVVAPGIACGPGNDCAENYASPMARAVQAIPNPGYAFAGWNGDCDGGSYTWLLVDRIRWCEPLFRALQPATPQDPRLAAGSLTIRSQAGEPIAGGVSATYLFADWFGFSYDHRSLTLYIPSGWSMDFRVPTPELLHAGTFVGAVGMSGSQASPGLSIRRPGLACDSSLTTGRFTIHEIRFAPVPVTMLEALSLDFEQQCGNGPVLRGSIRYRSSRTQVEPFADERRAFTRFDLTGDGSLDLVWQNRTDGRMLFWYLDGISYVFNEPPSIPQVADSNWHIVGIADADFDGYNDLYWQNQVTGGLAIWYMRGTQVVSTQMVTPEAVSDINWQIRAVTDVDRNGHPDLIWQHRVSGHIAVWYMNGRTLVTSDFLGPGQVADTNWTIVGAGDANGDGRPDLYWHHLGTGELAIWFMDGARLVSSTLLTPTAVADTNWRVRGIADFNRDGSPDVVWQNLSTSEVAVWLMNGSRVVESGLVTGPTMPAAEWVLVGPR